ncbi:type I methionyl aminopeptidase [Candidatus Omnitrophota bacterium]
MIPRKSEEELAKLKTGGKILARMIQKLKDKVSAGILTQEIDSSAEELAREEKVTPAFKGYRGYPASICISINEEIVHGIPSGRRVRQGDIVSLDMGIIFEGYFVDAAVTVAVGKVTPRARKLIEVTREALSKGITQARSGNHLYDISFAIQDHVEKNGFSVVREFVGHGIGSKLHEEPEIPNFGLAHRGEALKSGMVFAIEPMVNCGGWESRILDNGWTAVTKDGKLSAHFEHTVAITDQGPEILTN